MSEEVVAGGVLGEWALGRRLGGGSFGQVYRGRRWRREEGAGPDVEVALKLERVEEGEESLLGGEAQLLLLYQDSVHSAVFVGCGREGPVRWLAMERLGPTLEQLRRRSPGRRLSHSTALRVFLQALDAVRDFHDLTHSIHRDLKAANLLLGSTEQRVEPGRRLRLVLVDFGLARRFRRRAEETERGRGRRSGRSRGLRPPRPSAPFRGTLRYASARVHLGQEAGRADDLWSLLYVVLDLMDRRSLPWTEASEEEAELGRRKRAAPLRRLCRYAPAELLPWAAEVDRLGAAERPDYGHLAALLHQALHRLNVRHDHLLDWEPQPNP